MKISIFNEKILLQKLTTSVDEIGNQISLWSDFLFVYSYVSSNSPKETLTSGAIWDEGSLEFSIRYSSELKDITQTGYRVVFREEIYDIKGIDFMNYQKKLIKLRCTKEERKF